MLQFPILQIYWCYEVCVVYPKKRPSSSNKAVRFKMVEVRPQAKSASAPTKKPSDDFFAKEQQYK